MPRRLLPQHPAARAVVGVLCVIGGSIGVQYSVAIVTALFATVGTYGVNGLRMLFAGVVLFAIVRPRLHGRTKRAWGHILAFGLAMAAMNVLFYLTVERLPLGVAVTLEYLGPFAIAVTGVTRRWEMVFPVIALTGVILISNPGGEMDALGFAFGIGTAVMFGLYTVLAERVGRHSTGVDGLVLAVAIAAVALLPFSVEAAGRVQPSGWFVLALSGLLGVALAFTLDFTAVKLVSARVVATLFSIDPVIGSLIGVVILGQTLAFGVIVGIVLIVIAGAAVTWLAGRKPRLAIPPAD